MPIKIEISGETMDDIDAALRVLAKVDVRTMSLDDLLAITRARFQMAGFGVDLTPMDAQAGPGLAPENLPTPAEAEAIVESIEKALDKKAVKTAKKTTVAKKPAAPDPEPDGDKTYVVEEMIKRFADPRQKLKAKAFIDQVTGRHGGVRLSLLPAELFHDIRVEMETEFSIAKSNGGSEAHA